MIANSAIAKKNNNVEDRGGNHELFEHFMHSWVGYEIVQILFKYGLTPKIRTDLQDWSPQLHELFSYFEDKQRSTSNKPAQMLETLFEGTEHCSYFKKLPYGRRIKFEKMSNTTIPLVILTWLRQLQEYFFDQSEMKETIDWNDYGRYCNVPLRYAVNKGISNIHMSKANSTDPEKIDSIDCVAPNKKYSTKVVKSLFDWAELILCRENSYVENIAKSFENKKKKNFPQQYKMTTHSYKKTETKKGESRGDIETYTPEDQQHKTPEMLMSLVSGFMIDEIVRLPKATGKKNLSQKNIDLINKTNQAAACLVEYVNKTGETEKKFNTLKELKKFMTDEAEKQKEDNDGESSEEDEEEEYDDENDD